MNYTLIWSLTPQRGRTLPSPGIGFYYSLVPVGHRILVHCGIRYYNFLTKMCLFHWLEYFLREGNVSFYNFISLAMVLTHCKSFKIILLNVCIFKKNKDSYYESIEIKVMSKVNSLQPYPTCTSSWHFLLSLWSHIKTWPWGDLRFSCTPSSSYVLFCLHKWIFDLLI